MSKKRYVAIRKWLDKLEVGPLFIEPESPWENGYNESFNGKLRDELLNGEIFYTLKETQVRNGRTSIIAIGLMARLREKPSTKYLEKH